MARKPWAHPKAKGAAATVSSDAGCQAELQNVPSSFFHGRNPGRGRQALQELWFRSLETVLLWDPQLDLGREEDLGSRVVTCHPWAISLPVSFQGPVWPETQVFIQQLLQGWNSVQIGYICLAWSQAVR